jgi:hypothetical protein
MNILHDNDNEFRVEKCSLQCHHHHHHYLYVYIDCVCVCFLYMDPSNLRSLTPSKYFATVDLQTLLYRQFLLIHNQYTAVS